VNANTNILHSFAPGREVLRWFPLYRTKARQGDVVHGELLLRIHHVVRAFFIQTISKKENPF
jgi:hypothetical protein